MTRDSWLLVAGIGLNLTLLVLAVWHGRREQRLRWADIDNDGRLQ